MNIELQAVGFKLDNKLDIFIEKKIEKLHRFNENITGYKVFLNLDKSDTRENKQVEIKVIIPKGELFASKQCRTFEEAVDSVVDALKIQVLKQKEKLKA